MSQQDIFHNELSRRLFTGAFVMAEVVFGFALVYVFFYYGGFSFLALSSAVAATAGVMIGSSFAMSGFAYYFDFLDHRVAYRKYMGLIGFCLALLYSIMLLFVDSERYFYGFLKNLGTADFIFGLSAMAILTFMALISNNTAIKKLGAHTWRKCLRLGYVAYAFLIIRAFVLETEMWLLWFRTMDTLPPPRMLLTIFALSIIFLRISVAFSKFANKEKTI